MTASELVREARLLGIVAAGRRAGYTAMTARTIQAVAYLASAFDGFFGEKSNHPATLKIEGEFFDPHVRLGLDRLIARGLLLAADVGFAETNGGRARLTCNYSLEQKRSEPVLSALFEFPDERIRHGLCLEICLAARALGALDPTATFLEDAMYSDSAVGAGSLLDDVSGDGGGITTRIARRMQELSPGGRQISRTEVVHAYVRHLESLREVDAA